MPALRRLARAASEVCPDLLQGFISMRHPSVPAEPLQTVEQVAQQLGCSTRSVRRLIDSGELPIIHIGRLVRVHPDDLRRFIAARRNT